MTSIFPASGSSRPRFRLAALLVLAAGSVGCCKSEFPMIWVSPDLNSKTVIAAFKERPPAVKKVATVGVLLNDPDVRTRLEDVGLLDLAKKVPDNAQAEALAWETYCRWRKDEIVVGLFDPDTGKVLTVDGKEVFYVRVRIS